MAAGSFNLGTLFQQLKLDVSQFLQGMKTAVAAVDSLQSKLNQIHMNPQTIQEEIATAFDMSEPLEEIKQAVDKSIPEATKQAVNKTKKSVDDLGKMWEDDAQQRIKLAKEADKEILKSIEEKTKNLNAANEQAQKDQAKHEAEIMKLAQQRARTEEVENAKRIKDLSKVDAEKMRSLELATKAEEAEVEKRIKLKSKEDADRLKEMEKREKAEASTAAKSSKIWETYNRVTTKYFNNIEGEIEENAIHNETVTRKAALAMDKTWRGTVGRMKQSLREWFADATKNFSGIQDTANASFTQIIGGIAKMSLGFFVAMQMTQVFQLAIKGLTALVKGAIASFAQLEEQTINVARSLVISGQVGAKSFKSILPAAKAMTLELRKMGAEAGVSQDEFALMSQRLIQLGFGWKQAAKFAQVAAMTYKLNFGAFGQFFIVQQELTDLVTGNLEKSATMIRLIGARAVEEIRQLVMDDQQEKAIERLNQALGNTEEQFNILKRQIDNLTQQVSESFSAAAGGTKFGTALAEAWRDLLSQVNDDLREGGILWLAIQGAVGIVSTLVFALSKALQAINLTVGSVVLSLRAAYSWITESSKSIDEQDRLWTKISNNVVFKKIKEFHEWGVKIRQTLLDIVSKVPDIAAKGDAVAARRAKARGKLEILRGEEEAISKTLDAELKTGQKILDLKKTGAQFGADAVTKAQVELSILKQNNALQQNNLMAARDRKIEELSLMIDADDELEKKRNIVGAEIDALTQEMKRLDVENQIAEIVEKEATLRGRLAEIQAETSNAQLLGRAQHELQMTRMRAQQTSLTEQIKEQGVAKRTEMRLDLEGIQKEMALLQSVYGVARAQKLTEFQTLMQRRDSLMIMMQQNKEAEAILLKNIDITKEIERQKSLLSIEDIRIEGRKGSAQIKFESDQLNLSQQILTKLEEQFNQQKLQLDLKKTLNTEERKSLAIMREQALLTFEQAAATETESDKKEAAKRILDEQLVKYNENLRVNIETLAVIEEQYDVLTRMKDLELTRELAQGLNNAVNTFLEGLVEGEEKAQELFKDFAKSFLKKAMGDTFEKMINSLVTKLESGIESVAQKLANAFGGTSGFWGAFLNGMMAIGMAALSSLFNQQKAEVESLADEAKDTIESVERTRGLIAGETQIRIAEISDNLSKALRPTNDILMRIERAILNQPTGTANYGSQPQRAVGQSYSITTEILSASRQ